MAELAMPKMRSPWEAASDIIRVPNTWSSANLEKRGYSTTSNTGVLASWYMKSKSGSFHEGSAKNNSDPTILNRSLEDL